MNLLMPLAERARFENPEASETIGPDLISSFSSQSRREEPEVGEEPVRQHDRTREFCHSLATLSAKLKRTFARLGTNAPKTVQLGGCAGLLLPSPPRQQSKAAGKEEQRGGFGNNMAVIECLLA
jgi:hypothetical protein